MRRLFSFAVCLICLSFVAAAKGQSVTVIHNLVTVDGAFPIGPLINGPNGNFYGVTVHGGTFTDGTAFEVTPAGVVTVLHNFGTDATDGNGPTAGLLLATDGNFYGTTPFGGASSVGTVFRMTPQGIVTILHQFGVGTDGASPFGSLIEGSDGNFYGLTDEGGTANLGTVYRITPQGVITILHNFGDGSVTNDGTGPSAALIQATDGNFYGTTLSGGANSKGVVFKMTPQGAVTILHSFGDAGTPNDGIGPKANLIQAADGNFYSTTSQGGAVNGGTVFKITPQGGITILHSFLDGSVANDGSDPEASLLLGKDGNFYGVTNSGGGSPEEGCDFQITPQGVVTILHSFGDGSVIPDGGTPDGSLIQGPDGNFYGLTQNAGSGNNGVVYQLKTTVPQLTSDTNVTGTIGLPFFYQITGTNFPNIFATTPLPDGLSLSATGVISGTPTDVGTTSVTLTLTNGSGSGIYALTISIGALPAPAVTSILQAYGSVGNPFTYKTVANNLATSFAATGLTGTGLSLDPATGIISGTPTTVGTITSNLTASNSTGLGAASPLIIKIFASPPTLSQEYNLLQLFTDPAIPYNNGNPSVMFQAFDGNFYGLAGGGAYLNAGAIFKMDIQGNYSNFFSFRGDVIGPTLLIQASDGSFYGATEFSKIFKVDSKGNITLLYTFSDGAEINSLIQGYDGDFYGTTSYGGTAGQGSIFKISPLGVFTELHDFQGPQTDGANPQPLVQGADGNFYGTTKAGGPTNIGTVFKVTPQGVFTPLHSFVLSEGGFPTGLARASDGNFYGGNTQGGTGGSGTLFKVTPQGTVTILHNFQDGSVANDGATPHSPPVQGFDGNFYGTTTGGGSSTNHLGTIYQMTPQGAVTIIHNFPDPTVAHDGNLTFHSLIQTPDGNFYGFNVAGGVSGGTIFSIIASQSKAKAPIFTGSAYASSDLYTPFSYTPKADFGVSGSGAETGNVVQPQSPVGFMSAILSLLPQMVHPAITTTNWTLTGTLPNALDFDGTSGTISGTPTQSGTFQLSITAHNALGDSSPQIVTLYINVPPGISSPITASAVVGTAFNYQITALPLALSYGATGLPGWLNADIFAGTITGTPPAAGHYLFNAVANNEAGQTVQPITLTVTGGTSVPVITSAATAAGAAGAPFTYTITTNPAATSYTALVLPDGLQFNEPTGTILGTPTTAGTYRIPVTATDATGTYASILTLTVGPPVAPTLRSPLTAIASPGYPFIYAIPSTGTVALYHETGALPDGLTFDPATGVISGTPTGTGTFPIGLTATNTSGAGTANLTLTVTSSTGFADWSAAHNFSGGPDDTPEKDGVPNLLKYIYNIDPTRPMSATDRAALPVVGTAISNGTEVLTLTFREYSQSVIAPVIQTCTDLQTWNAPASYTVIQTGTDAFTGDPIMQAQVPVTTAKQFIRINVTPP